MLQRTSVGPNFQSTRGLKEPLIKKNLSVRKLGD